MLKEITTWLGNPKRTYVSGLSLFNLLATDSLKKKYGAYLNGVDPATVKSHSSHYNILCNKLSSIAGSMRANPEAFASVFMNNTSAEKEVIKNQVSQIIALNNSKQELQQQLDEANQSKQNLQRLNDNLKSKSDRTESLKVEKEDLNNKFSSLVDLSSENKTKEDDLLSQLQEKSEAIDKLTGDIDRASKEPLPEGATPLDVAALKKQIKDLTKEKTNLEKELEKIRQKKAKLEQESSELNQSINERDEEIDTLTGEIEDLEDEISELNDSLDEKDEELQQLQSDIEVKDSEIDTLKKSLEEKNLKVLSDDDLLEEVKQKRIRIKEIVPLMAKIHAELSNTTISDAERKKLAKEVCNLDDERRRLWDEVDEYLGNSDSVLPEENKTGYSEDPLLRGMQIANRIKRLKENIKRNQDAAIEHEANEKPNLALKARDNVIRYAQELEELQTEVDEKK